MIPSGYRFIFRFILPIILFSPSLSYPNEQYKTYGVEHFSWEEYNNAYGNQKGNWVSEYGPRFHFGTVKGNVWSTDNGLYYRDENDTTLGLVRYDGSLIKDPDYVLKYYAAYLDHDFSRQMGYRIPLHNRISISPNGTLGIKGWIRAILPKKVYKNHPTEEARYAGAFEAFLEPYVKLGLSVRLNFNSHYQMIIEYGQQHPITTLEWNAEGGFLKPKANWNPYAGIELHKKGDNGYFVRLDYRKKIYDTSELNSDNWFQPESHERTIGMSVGFKY